MWPLHLVYTEGAKGSGKLYMSKANCLLVAAVTWSAALMYVRQSIDAGEAPLMKYMGEALLHNEKLFLFNNITFDKDYTILPFRGETYYPRPIDSLFSISVALIILALRMFYNNLVDNLVAAGLFTLSDGKSQKAKLAENHHLESWYRGNRNPSASETEVAARRAGVSTTYVQNWLRKRKNCDKLTTRNKFCESSFKFAYYFAMSLYGIFTLWNKYWFHDTTELHRKINMVDSLHEMEPDIFIYYQVELGIYWCLFISQFTDMHRHSDFWPMFAHHVITLLLLVGSFSTGFHRIGAIVVATHDVSDWALELSKTSAYLKKKLMTGVGLALLVGSWLATRLIYYPLYVIPITIEVCAHLTADCKASHYAFIGLLCALVPLHFTWFYLICYGAYRHVMCDAYSDPRSDSESGEDNGEKEAEEVEYNSVSVNGAVAKKVE